MHRLRLRPRAQALRLALLLLTPGLGREAAAQPPAATSVERATEVLPPEIVRALQAPNGHQTLFTVSGKEHFKGQVLRADQLVFSEGGHLILDSTEAPWILIVARTIKFQKPELYSRISFAPKTAAQGASGAAGANGAHGVGQGGGRHGLPGQHGATGGTGGQGAHLKLPHLYLVTEEILSPGGVPPFVSLAILANGLDGGRGGTGGNGGQGGNGGAGLHGASGLFDCKRGAGDGGPGGNGGPGGRGGNGGPGGDGGSLSVISTRQGVELLSYTRLFNAGGYGGIGGEPGAPGNPGAGGSGGDKDKYCGRGHRGGSGGIPSPKNLGSGQKGPEGAKGQFRLILANDLTGVFNPSTASAEE